MDTTPALSWLNLKFSSANLAPAREVADMSVALACAYQTDHVYRFT